eukprot:CAMPEP_0118709466 /NCGR_PEP_ID=MMETSP0800-20121206/22661_1 /TAXON_ID=210618 ORGANISM="Striatella unipunctata, Strain CCMP2910" /NCGR_SAMPLE_ID=MMETSP0800 /ASSEMBLY_ACC=CAM_ASM_000638 /LENGTH=241 /DNA_ID=CAMNT_0006613179 /DNA_START=163 /DNA_END=888 /DNA_ORIENTATION=+
MTLYIQPSVFTSEEAKPKPVTIERKEYRMRRVRLSDDVKVIPPPEPFTPQEVRATWWQKEDYAVFKKTSKMIAMELRYHNLADQCLRTAYDRACSASIGFMADNEIEEYLRNTKRDEDLVHWAQRPNRRGLERWASKKHGSAREVDSILGVKVLLREQRRQRNEEDYSPEKLARVAEKASRTARIFARMMAQADAVPLRCEKSSSAGKRHSMQFATLHTSAMEDMTQLRGRVIAVRKLSIR